LNACDDSGGFGYTNKHAGVIKIITVSAKASNNRVSNHSKARPVQKCASYKISRMVIVGMVTIDDGSGENVGEPRKLDGIELVLPLPVSASSHHKCQEMGHTSESSGRSNLSYTKSANSTHSYY
jgi:hypothetical protein